ncbi:MAG: hypothetical protein GX675_07290 [Erysipelotrichaceae bacterium]|nr:hypothetical protein [Erysipelotrichaceae bacterium]
MTNYQNNNLNSVVLSLRLPYKMEYKLNEEFDSTGLLVYANYSDGCSYLLSENDYTIVVPKEFYTTSGTHSVEIIYNLENCKTLMKVQVSKIKAVELKILQINNKPYFESSVLVANDLLVSAYFDDYSSMVLSPKDYYIKINDIKIRADSLNYVFSNSDTISGKKIEVIYLNLSTIFSLDVLKIAENNLDFKEFPETIFYSDENIYDMLLNNLKLVLEYNNAKRIDISKKDYSLNIINKSNNLGEVQIKYQGKDKLHHLNYNISIVEKNDYDFKKTYFGQSINKSRNYIKEKKYHVNIVSHNNGGKITKDHDGITYYYTILEPKTENFQIEAEIEVVSFVSNIHNGQESFGIMLRDKIGDFKDNSIVSSNIISFGVYSGSPYEELFIQLFSRSISYDNKEKLKILFKKKSIFNYEEKSKYRFYFKKDGDNYSVKALNLETNSDSGWISEYLPNLIDSSKKQYLGFYTAKEANIKVSKISLKTSKERHNLKKILVEDEKKIVKIENFTKTLTSKNIENIMLSANTKGIIEIYKDEKNHRIFLGSYNLFDNKILKKAVELAPGENHYFIIFKPSLEENILKYNPLFMYITIIFKEIYGDIFVSPVGKADNLGTIDSPLDIYSAIDLINKGNKIIMAGGNYNMYKPLKILNNNNVYVNNYKYLIAQELKNRPIINFNKEHEGLLISADFWHIKNIDITNSKDNSQGIIVEGNNNIIEGVKTYCNGDTGLQISCMNENSVFEEWPSNNLIYSCESFDNRDSSNSNADGFAAKLRVGNGNIFKHCISYNNIDDGFDLYTKIGMGAIGTVLIDNCIAYNNGKVSYDKVSEGDGNGFKMGGEEVAVRHVIKNSITFNNYNAGLTNNSNPSLDIINVLSYDNRGRNFILKTNKKSEANFNVKSIYSFRTFNNIISSISKIRLRHIFSKDIIDKIIYFLRKK